MLIVLITRTVKPPNKGHVGNNIDSQALSLVERLSCSHCIDTIKKWNFRVPRVINIYTVERFVMQCPFLGGSTIGGFTVRQFNTQLQLHHY